MNQDLESFRTRVEHVVEHHPVVMDNTYTKWFAKGEATRGEVRHLAVQFSVFSHQFVEAALRKVINAADLQSYRAGKEILMNELGVIYRPAGGRSPVADADDPEFIGTEGSVDASTFRFSAAHFEWLLSFGAPLGPFISTLLTNASVTDLWGSVVKTTIFGAIIAIVCCYKGMTASGGAEGVGRSVNQAVVIAFLGIFAFNYVFTQTLLATHPEISVIK